MRKFQILKTLTCLRKLKPPKPGQFVTIRTVRAKSGQNGLFVTKRTVRNKMGQMRQFATKAAVRAKSDIPPESDKAAVKGLDNRLVPFGRNSLRIGFVNTPIYERFGAVGRAAGIAALERPTGANVVTLYPHALVESRYWHPQRVDRLVRVPYRLASPI